MIFQINYLQFASYITGYCHSTTLNKTSETGTESNEEEERKVAKDNPYFPQLQSLTFNSNQALKH
jgi:hypothetical protein